MSTGELSVAAMRKHIEAGNVVLYRGRIIKNVKDLPQESEHAVTLEEKMQAARKLQQEIDERERQLDVLMRDIRAAGPAKPQAQAQTAPGAITQNTTQNAAPTNTAEVSLVPENTGAANTAANTGAATADQTQQNQPPQTNTKATADVRIANKPVSFWQDLAEGAKDEAEAKQRFLKIKGMNDQLAQQALDAVKAASAS